MLRARASRAPLTSSRTAPIAIRQLHQTASVRAYKDDQDRESLKPKAHEYSQSGTDDGAAAQEAAAFDPSKTDPESAKETAGKGPGSGNPLEFSPANKGAAEGGAGREEDKTKGGKQKRSESGSPEKKGKP